METSGLLKQLSLEIDTDKINGILKELENSDFYNSVIELYNSIWKMTYDNSSEIELQKISQLSISHRISLMNEQEDLIPSELVPIEEIETLDLGGFPEAVLFPELLRYTNLKSLDLWENNLTELPDSFFELTSLKSLYICDALTILPSSIEKLRNLEYLNLHGNKLVSVPKQLELLENLIILDLNDNRIAQFSVNVKKMKKLQKIDLRFNSDNLTIAPEVIEECKKSKIELIY